MRLASVLLTYSVYFMTVFGQVANASSASTEIRFLAHGEQSLAARLLAIESASKSITLMTYLWRPCDSSTKLIAKALIAKAAEGKIVRVMVDAYELSPKDKSDLAAYFSANKIGFKVYNDAFLMDEGRSHAKVLLIDAGTPQAIYFVGGRNNSDEYFGLSAKMNYLDQDLMIKDKSAAQVALAVKNLWNSRMTSVPSSRSMRPSFKNSCLSTNRRDKQVSSYMTENAKSIYRSLPIYTCSDISYSLDNPAFYPLLQRRDIGEKGFGPMRFDPLTVGNLKNKTSTKMFLDFLAGTKKSLKLENQYYIPRFGQKTAFKALRSRGRSVTILTNSTGDEGFHKAVFTAQIQSSVHRDSVESQQVFTVSGIGGLNDEGDLSYPGAPWRIHTKSGVRDETDVLVSSYNIDGLSYEYNVESAVVVRNCPELARDMTAEYQKVFTTIVRDRKSCGKCQQEVSAPGIIESFTGLFSSQYF